ncbi:putative radical SAM domain protein [Megalodesulfovibrio gigas DSM 1382 = ATCC 19364]|uniref:Putative radical SAM domain protein n=2 Tax=Megalodesulfovibrio gigas TaxID=879 RepID=T2G622_MEGG1|nr:putative radical SAM domain protein [Megalodesulfovibrio gigas DSM 1382 = ATCC 19364]
MGLPPLVVLVTPTPPDLSAFGVRSISAHLRRKGLRTRIIFLPGSLGLLKQGGTFVYRYPEAALRQVAEHCRGATLVGLSFMTNYLDRAAQCTRAIQEIAGVPVIWGGVHATLRPEQALEYADYVCVGEGEEALLELTAALTSQTAADAIPGVWTKVDGRIRDNGCRPLIADLDSLPAPDVSNVEHYVLDPIHEQIIPLTDALYIDTLPLVPYYHNARLKAYRIMTDRGCPHRCSYCNVPALKDKFAGDAVPYFRSRSVPHVMAELEDALARFPQIKAVQFFDDTFFARPVTWLREFAEQYKKRIKMPFYCQASPTTLTQEKLRLLMDAGMVYVEMGVQTGSPRIRAMYGRKESNAQIVAGARLVHKHVPPLLPPHYHVIMDNPWETMDDLMQTVQLLHQIPKPYGLAISSLVFFPGTAIARKAMQEGIIDDEEKQVFRQPFYIPPTRHYPGLLLYLQSFMHFPQSIIAVLLREGPVRRLLEGRPAWFYGLFHVVGEACRAVAKAWKLIARGDISRIRAWIDRQRRHDPVVAGRKG